jgi:tripeptidyl-peptidase-1
MGNSSQTGNEIGIFEDGDYYDQADLDLTFQAVAPYVPAGTHPILNGIDGGTAPFMLNGEPYIGAESLLDMSLILPLIYPNRPSYIKSTTTKKFNSPSKRGLEIPSSTP